MSAPHAPYEYQASAFHGRERLFGGISIDAAALTFEAGGLRVSLPLKDIVVTAGGAGSRMLFFTHASRPEWTVCTTDPAILDAAALASDPWDPRPDNSDSGGQTTVHPSVCLHRVAFCRGGIWGLFMLKEPVVAAIADRIPPGMGTEDGGCGLFRHARGETNHRGP